LGGVWEESEAREEQEDDDEPASVRDGSEADEAGERGREEEDERDSLERKAAVSEPMTACGDGIVVGDCMCGGKRRWRREQRREEGLMRGTERRA
jgi:hypothetical protein